MITATYLFRSSLEGGGGDKIQIRCNADTPLLRGAIALLEQAMHKVKDLKTYQGNSYFAPADLGVASFGET